MAPCGPLYSHLRFDHQLVCDSEAFRLYTSGTLGAADGKTAYVAFADSAEVAAVDLENQTVRYISAAENGSAAFTIGLSNNVCH